MLAKKNNRRRIVSFHLQNPAHCKFLLVKIHESFADIGNRSNNNGVSVQLLYSALLGYCYPPRTQVLVLNCPTWEGNCSNMLAKLTTVGAYIWLDSKPDYCSIFIHFCFNLLFIGLITIHNNTYVSYSFPNYSSFSRLRQEEDVFVREFLIFLRRIVVLLKVRSIMITHIYIYILFFFLPL